MTHLKNSVAAGFGALFLLAVCCQNLAAQPYLTPIGSVPLEGVEGRLDHMAADTVSQRLFVAALENHSIEVIDLAQRKRIHQIPGILEPQGIAFVRESALLLVCSRGDGTCRSFDANTFAPGPWVDLGRNADNARFDAASHAIYAGSGAEPGPGLLSAIDVDSFLPAGRGGKQAPPISPADLLLVRPRQAKVKSEALLKAHPESFQVDPQHHRVFVNVPDEHQIAVLESTAGELKFSQSWPVTVAEKNFPMALDAAHSRLFIACRKPALVALYDTDSGKLIAQSPCVGDSDDIFYDTQAGRLYVIGGEGFVDVFDAPANTKVLPRLAQIPTVPKARTGLFIPESKTLAVAVPKTPRGPSTIFLFEATR